MSKHRKKQPFRRIVIATAAISAVGVPSVALACTGWQGDGGHRAHRAEDTAAAQRWNQADRGHDRSGDRNGHERKEPTVAASKTPTAAPSATRSTAPKATVHRTRPTAPARTKAEPASRASGGSSPARTPKPTTPATTPAATPTAQSLPTPGATASGATARVVQLVNAERAKVGCSALTVNAALTKAAQAHSQDMAAHRNMSHTGSDGSSPGDRITGAGYQWSAYGENVAYGYATPEQVMAAWMASPGHKANILNCSYKEIGVGLAQPGDYWTQDFGASR